MLKNFVPPAGFQFEYHEEIGSTNDRAKTLGAGWIVAAGRQTAGRGRMGRPFSCQDGGLWFSVAVKPDCPFSESFSLPVAAAVCARNAIGGEAKIKWPNDILVDGKKVCGILCEAVNGVIVLGFGINLKNALPDDLPDAGRVEGEPEVLLRRIVEELALLLREYPENRPTIIQAYCEHCVTLMKYVDVVYRNMPLYGFACAIDKNGGLMVMTQESRTVVTIYSGEATIVKKRDGDDPDVPAPPRV